MKCYALGAQTRAAEVMHLFCEGVKGEFVRHATNVYEGGDIALWGMLRGAKELRRYCAAAGGTYYALDHAYIGRERYFRVTRNGFQQTQVFERPSERWTQLSRKCGIVMREWRRAGEYVLVAVSSPHTYEYFDIFGWPGIVQRQLREYTDRPVVLRTKAEKETLANQLRRAWAVVTWTSMVAVDAVLAGVPVFCLGPSVARPMGLAELSRIEEPIFPEREKWCHSLAYAQFKVDEMKAGIVKPLLDEFPVSYEHYGY